MPTYDFVCSNCDYKMERFVPISFPKKSFCPQCKQNTFIRCIGTGSGIVFKGKGFYETDYKQKGDWVKENDEMNKERDKRSKIDPDY